MATLRQSLDALADAIDQTTAATNEMAAEMRAARERLRNAVVDIQFTENGRPTGRRIIVPLINWDQFDREVLAQWRRDESRLGTQPSGRAVRREAQRPAADRRRPAAPAGLVHSRAGVWLAVSACPGSRRRRGAVRGAREVL